MSRDPIGENRSEQIREGNHQLTEAGPNLHAFVENDPMSKVDLLGLDIGKGGPYALPIDCGTWVCVNGNKSYAFTLIICWDPNKGEKNSFEFMRCKRRVKRLFDLACECAASWATQGRIGNALKKCYDDYGPGTVVPPPQTLPYFPKPI